MILERRIECLSKLGTYMLGNDESWKRARERAFLQNAWFTQEFIDLAVKNIATNFLQPQHLENWAANYRLPDVNSKPKRVGLVMAGNIPLVGFHDLLSVFISGHEALIKRSSKDSILVAHLVTVMAAWDPGINDVAGFSEVLKNCDAYIATGSNNTARYFEFYFAKYPHVIRRNKTSVAVLSGNETTEDLHKLADDVHQFFGLGCRNVTKLYVPQDYDFNAFLAACTKYRYLADHPKYKNNYDYNLALQILNNQFYMTNGSLLLVENRSVFSPISQLNYEYYTDKGALPASLEADTNVQAIVGYGFVPFGAAQSPALDDYADRVDTMAFLTAL